MTEQEQAGRPRESAATLLARARKCHQEETRAKRAHEARQRALYVSVARALAGGVSAVDLAALLGVTRQRVYQMKDEATAPRAV